MPRTFKPWNPAAPELPIMRSPIVVYRRKRFSPARNEPWPPMATHGHLARSSGVAESGRLVRRMSHRVDPAAIAEEARTVRLDAVLGPPRRSVPYLRTPCVPF
jgi:hypothetical protein